MIVWHYQIFVNETITLKTTNLKYQEEHGMKSLKYPMDLIPYQTPSAISNTSSKNMKDCLINHQLKYMSTEFRTGLFGGTEEKNNYTQKMVRMYHI